VIFQAVFLTRRLLTADSNGRPIVDFLHDDHPEEANLPLNFRDRCKNGARTTLYPRITLKVSGISDR